MAVLYGQLEACPRCKQVNFGRCMVKSKGLLYKCNSCSHFELRPLPLLTKTIVYLDQFALSKMIKNCNDPFWHALHEKLDHLCRNELVVCPFSPIHVEESKFDTRLRNDLKSLYRRFAGDSEFRDAFDIEKRQLARSLRAFIGCTNSPASYISVDDGFEKSPHRWSDVLNVYADFEYREDLIDRLRSAKNACHNGMVALSERWKASRPTFESQAEAEAATFVDRIELYRKVTGGDPNEFSPSCHPPELDVVNWLAHTIWQIDPDEKDPLSLLARFARSPQYRDTPYTFVWCRIWSKMAEMVVSPKGARKPKASDLYDAKVLAAYAPYCSAMFLDGGFREIAIDGRIDVQKQFGVRIFSEQVRDDFLDYLEAIRCGATAQHWDALRLVYDSLVASDFE